MSTKEDVLIYCPREIEQFVTNCCVNEYELGTARDYRQALAAGMATERFRVIPVSQGDDFMLPIKQPVRVNVFQMRHAVPCVGYGVVPLKKKLRDEYRGVAGSELGRLRKEGVKIEDIVENAASGFVYCGDTGIEAIVEHMEAFSKYGTIIVESTFLYAAEGLTDEAIMERCTRDGHIFFPQLLPFILAHRQIRWVLIHFSLRYTREEIRSFFESDALKQHDLSHVTVLASRYCDQ